MCFGAADLKPIFVTDHDASTPTVACYPLDTVTDVTRLTYYAAKTIEILSKAVAP